MERKSFHLLGDMEKSWWYRGRTAIIHAALAHSGPKNVPDALDFGAGYGGMYEALAQIGRDVHAYEPDEEANVAAKRRGYTQMFSSEKEALGREYDLIGLFDVIEHIEHDKEFLNKARYALRVGGRLAITVPAFQFLWSAHDVNHHHFRRYTKDSMRVMLNDAGFTVEYASYWNMILFIPAAVMRLLGKSGESALAMPRWLDAIFFTIIKIEALFLRFVPLPFGTSLVVIARLKQ
jgi:SAM-dependent methyltransferase